MTFLRKKITLIVLWLFALLQISSVFAQNDELDELDDFLNEILWEEDLGDTPTTQSADAEGILDDVLGEDSGEDHDSAEDILDNQDEEKWSYAKEPATVEVISSNTTSATIQTTKVLFDGEAVKKYTVFYSEKPILDQDTDLIKDLEAPAISVDDNDDVVNLTLTSLKPNTKYYISIDPLHPTDDLIPAPTSFLTNEIDFTTSSTQQPEGNTEDKKTEDEENKNVENNEESDPQEQQVEEPVEIGVVFDTVSNSVNDNKVTVRWKTIPDALTTVKNAQVRIRHQTEQNFSSVWSPNYANGVYTFNVSRSGTHYLKLDGLDAQWQEVWDSHTQTIKIIEVQEPTENDEPAIANPPKVWPTTDLLIWLMIFGVILYVMYRFRRKSNI